MGGVSCKVQGPEETFMKGAGGALTADFECSVPVGEIGAAAPDGTVIYLYAVGASSPICHKSVPISSDGAGSIKFPTTALKTGQSYVFKWFAGKHGLIWNYKILAESHPFEVNDFESIVSKHTATGNKMAVENKMELQAKLDNANVLIERLKRENSTLKRKLESQANDEGKTAAKKKKKK